MADNTLSKQQHQEALQKKVEAHDDVIQEMKERLNQLTDMVRKLVANQNTLPNRELQMVHNGEGQDNRRGVNRGVKLDFPHFEGENPAGWVFKVTLFFEFYQTPPAQRLLIASYHMEGEALVWYQYALDTGEFNSWDTFVQALLVRFVPTAHDDPMEALTRLKQTSTVSAYNTQFESLSYRLKGLSNHHKLSCFLSGLKDEIGLPIRMFNPTNVCAAFGLAKIQEEYLLSARRGLKQHLEKTSPMPPLNPPQWGTPAGSSNKNQKPYQPAKKISSNYMDERRKKGLCSHCDEKWNPSHNCKSPKIYLLQGSEDLGDAKLEGDDHEAAEGGGGSACCTCSRGT